MTTSLKVKCLKTDNYFLIIIRLIIVNSTSSVVRNFQRLWFYTSFTIHTYQNSFDNSVHANEIFVTFFNVRSRHRCEVCTDFDLYLDCFSLIKKKSRICKSSRYVHHKSHTFSLFKCIPANNSRCVPVNNVSHTVQADRKKTLQEYLKILNHAAYCVAAYHLDVK